MFLFIVNLNEEQKNMIFLGKEEETEKQWQNGISVKTLCLCSKSTFISFLFIHIQIWVSLGGPIYQM